MGVQTTLGAGYSPTAAAEQQAVVLPGSWNRAGVRRGIVYCHSLGATAPYGLYPTANTSVVVPAIARYLADQGWPIVGPDLGGDTWGNATGDSRTAEAKTYLQGAVGAPSGSIVLWAWSHGGTVAMNYAKRNLSSVKAMVLFQPACDLTGLWTTNPGGTATASINAAYGGAYSDATYGPTRSPVQFAAELAGIPTLIHYATDDAMVAASSVTTLAAGIGSSCTLVPHTGGHGDGGLANIDVAAVASWLATNG